MTDSPRGAQSVPSGAGSPAPQINPADNDYEGMCINCTCTPAVLLWQGKREERVTSEAFCSFDCAVVYAFDFAERQAEGFTEECPTCDDDCVILCFKTPFELTPDAAAQSREKDGA